MWFFIVWMKMPESDNRSLEDDKALWDLLGNASQVEPGPMFSRNVIRAVRLDQDEESGILAALVNFFRQPAFASVALGITLLAGGLLLLQQEDSDVHSLHSNVEPTLTEEVESISQLGELVAVADPSELSDEALLNLLF